MPQLDPRAKLAILADAAKYDASCASSGTAKRNSAGGKVPPFLIAEGWRPLPLADRADLLGELRDLEFGSAEWDARFAEMRHRYEHHIDEEEEEMFPAAAEQLSDAEEARLARVFEARKPVELERAEANPPGDGRE